MTVTTRTIPSPIGALLLVGDGQRLSGLFMTTHRRPPAVDGPIEDGEAFPEAVAQLRAWFDGTRRAFDLDLEPRGSAFQRTVWDALLDIPFGETTTYGEVAARVGRPGSARAVGHAVGRNPIGIVVPCHRVVGADGTLTGYAGGLDKKRWLLEHERRVAGASLV
jgi:methylated-DNA-[protein]-cysteine S-methyltransferase